MSSSPRHARPSRPHASRRAQLLLRAGLTVTAAGAVVGGAAGSAMAAPAEGAADHALTDTDLGSAVDGTSQGLTAGASGALHTVTDMSLNPLAGTAADPADNAVGTTIADFKPISTAPLTEPLHQGDSLGELLG